MTELEYREAYSMLKKGLLIGLLLYMIDSEAIWPLNLIERNFQKVQKLRTFKERLTTIHTVTFFKSSEDLPHLILRDVIRKIGFSVKQVFRARTKAIIRKINHLNLPVGMEYYTEELASIFQGREEESNNLLDQVIRHKMSLLIGSSGIGKTSLISAGLFPKLRELGWRTALIRPLTEPLENMRRSLWSQLMEGVPPKDFDFPAVVHTVANSHAPTHVLAVIDQFEDILGYKASKDAEPLTQALLNLYTSAESNLRILISYRGDVEAQIGATWQTVSGSAGGLPRLYLGALTEEGCEKAFKVNLKALRISLGNDREAQRLVSQILEDLAGESLLGGFPGIYPPFLQMIISRACADADRRNQYTESAYTSAGRCQRIISDYLIGQLKYLGKNEKKGKEALIALVSSYGTKSQKTADEIAVETLQNRKEVERTLKSLIDLRMVRAINDHFEIVHDFLAKNIIAELVAADEREAKKFKELLASRAAAYADTKANLTRAEHIYLYKYRNKILCTEDEVKLLLASYFAGNGPIHFWLKSYPKKKIATWARSELSGNDNEVHRNVFRFLIKLGEPMSLEEVADLFSDYKLKSELGEFILKLATPNDISLLLKLHRKRREEVVDASEKALLNLVSLPDGDLLDQLGKSNTQSSRRLFEILSLKCAKLLSLEDIRSMWKTRKLRNKLLSLYALGIKGERTDFDWLQEVLKEKKLNKKFKLAVVKSLVRLSARFEKADIVKSFLRKGAGPVRRATLEALEAPIPNLTLKDILIHYKEFPRETASAVRRLATEKDFPFIQESLKKIKLDPPAREIVMAVCDKGGEADFDFLWDLFTKYQHRVDFWNASVVLRAMAKLAGRRHLPLLNEIIQLEEFWEYFPRDERPSRRISVADFDNLYFIRRLVGITYAEIAGRSQFRKLLKLLEHNYWIISDAAADAVINLAKPSDLPQIIERTISFRQQYGIIKVLCNLDERFHTVQ